MKRGYTPPESAPDAGIVKAPRPTVDSAAKSLANSKRLMGERNAAERRQGDQPNAADPDSHLSLGFVDEDDCTLWYCRKYYVEIPGASAEYVRMFATG